MASSVLNLGVVAQQNDILSWWIDMSPRTVKKQDPGLLDSSTNGVFPLAGAISGSPSEVEEERGI